MGVRTVDILRRERVEISVPALIELFIATKQIEGRTKKTISWYRNMLERFSTFLGDDAKLADVSVHDARAFVASLQDQGTRYPDHPFRRETEGGLSLATIHAYVRALKAFSSCLAEEGFTHKDIFARLRRPKTPESVIEVLSESELARLIAAINPDCILGARLYAAVLLLLDTGIRASELCGLTLDNVHIDDGYIKVFGKGRKERIVPFGNTTNKALLRWLITWRDAVADDNDSLFVTVDGTPLTYGALAKSIRRLGRKAGVPRLHSHLIRHTFAVRYLMNGGDVMTLRLILGHSTLEVTQMHMHLAEAHVRVQHHKFSPVDRLGIGARRGIADGNGSGLRFQPPNEDIERFLESLGRSAIEVVPSEELTVTKRDPGGSRYLECAVARDANIIVAGDQHLLQLGEHQGIQILTPTGFLALPKLER